MERSQACITEAKIAYRYCKSQTIAVCKSISILIILLKRTNCNSRNEAAYYPVACYKEDQGTVFTCAANSIPRVPWLAGAHKGSFSVFTSSVYTTVVLSCFTFIYICN